MSAAYDHAESAAVIARPDQAWGAESCAKARREDSRKTLSDIFASGGCHGIAPCLMGSHPQAEDRTLQYR
jgi:hypothetical protein